MWEIRMSFVSMQYFHITVLQEHEISIKETHSKPLAIWRFITIFTGYPLGPVLSSHCPTLFLYILYLHLDLVFSLLRFPVKTVYAFLNSPINAVH